MKKKEARILAKQTEKEIYERMELAAEMKEKNLTEANRYVQLRKEAYRLRKQSIDED